MKNFTSSGRLAASFSFCLGLFFSLPQGMHAQGVEGAPITSIDVRYVGPETISKAQILANMKTKIGTPYSETTVEDDIRSLYDDRQNPERPHFWRTLGQRRSRAGDSRHPRAR